MNRTVPILAITVLSLTSSALAWGEDGGGVVKGGATTTVAGGTGAPDFTPVITKLTFHWRDRQGRFEGLALPPPSAKAGNPGGGDFDTHVMYATGAITRGPIKRTVSVFTGPATPPRPGARTHVPLTA